jgi:hypothetical protein
LPDRKERLYDHAYANEKRKVVEGMNELVQGLDDDADADATALEEDI